MGMMAILVIRTGPLIQIFVPTSRGGTTLTQIWTPEHGYTIS